MPSIVHIAVPCPLRRCFDYYSDREVKSWQAGCRVRIPFGSRQLIGIVITASEVKADTKLDKLKTIIEVIDDQSNIPTSLFKLIQWASNYYHHPLGDCFQVALPRKIRDGSSAILQLENYWHSGEQPTNKLGNKQQEIIELLQRHPEGLLQSRIYSELGQVRSSLVGLQKKGLIVQNSQIKKPDVTTKITQLITLNDQQQAVVDQVSQNFQQFSPFLLHGITGSGKTEVYIKLTAQIVAKNKQVLILIPEIGLTEQFVERFKRHLASCIVVLNSAMTDLERQQAWLLAKEGIANVIIGTRSAVFTPTKDLGLIIIDEEHDGSYKQQESLRYHARNIALVRAQNDKVAIVLGSATPSLESLYKVEQGQYQLLKLTERATGATLPKVRLVDSTGPKADNVISSELYKAITTELAAENQVLLFINRRGYAPILMCHDCQWQASCPQCDAKMIVHKQRYQLRCHHCNYVQSLVKQCPECQSSDVSTYGAGTEQIEDNLQNYFPETPILRIDRDSTQRVGAFSKLVAEIRQGGAKILVGTQMLAKGHDFHDVTLVGVLDADHGLFSADFRAMETLAQLITQVTGRAGRGKKPGQVLIQTSQIADPFWENLIEGGYSKTAQKLLAQRLESAMPPAASLCVIRAQAKDQAQSAQFLSEVAALFQQADQQDVLILGPVPAVMEKKAGYYRAQLLLTTSHRRVLHQLLDHYIDAISALKLAQKVRWSIDIDPMDLF